jgi:uncharacterized sporulation protein YeaH/YhbH (DUF444 family)
MFTRKINGKAVNIYNVGSFTSNKQRFYRLIVTDLRNNIITEVRVSSLTDVETELTDIL